MSRKAWEYARNNHTKEHFTQAYRVAVEQIIAQRSTKEQVTVTDNQVKREPRCEIK